MEKQIVYLFSDGFDYEDIAFQDLSGITGWIEADDLTKKTDEELSEMEYTIRVKRMTQEEIDNLEEAV